MRFNALLSALVVVAIGVLAGPAQATQVSFSQGPDMNLGTDILSMHRAYGPVVVDDFIVNTPTIIGFRWWGSYFSGFDPTLRPGQMRLVSFEISHHADCPGGVINANCTGDPRNGNAPYLFSTPGQPYQFQVPVVANETFFGLTAGGERVYEYFALLPAPWAAFQNQIAWVDIAWNAGQFGTDPLAAVWGWHESDEHFQDWAVQTDAIANQQLPLGGNPHLGPWNLLDGRDMAFQVITVPEPGTVSLIGLALLGLVVARRRSSN